MMVAWQRILRFSIVLVVCCDQQIEALGTCRLIGTATHFIVVEDCTLTFQFGCDSTRLLDGYCYKDYNDSRATLPKSRFRVGTSNPHGVFTVSASPVRGDDGEVNCTADGFTAARLVLEYVARPVCTIQLRSKQDNRLEFTCILKGQSLSAQYQDWQLHLLRNGQSVGKPAGPINHYGHDTLKQEFLTQRQSDSSIYTCQATTTFPVSLPCVRVLGSTNSVQIPQTRLPTQAHSTPTPPSTPTARTTLTTSSSKVPSTTPLPTDQATMVSASHHNKSRPTLLIESNNNHTKLVVAIVAATAAIIVVLTLGIIVISVCIYIRRCIQQAKPQQQQQQQMLSSADTPHSSSSSSIQLEMVESTTQHATEVVPERTPVQETQETIKATQDSTNWSDKDTPVINPCTTMQPQRDDLECVELADSNFQVGQDRLSNETAC